MAAELPTEVELKKLYEEKGRLGLTWYVWRHALRVLPILGRLPKERYFIETNRQSIFFLCKVNLLIASLPISSNMKGYRKAYRQNKFESFANEEEALYPSVLATLGLANSDSFVSDILEASDARANSTSSLEKSELTKAIDHLELKLIKEAYNALNRSSRMNGYELIHYAARSDYNYVIKNSRINALWLARTLWPRLDIKQREIVTKPTYFDQDCKEFIARLNSLGLSFISDDLSKLWTDSLDLETLRKNRYWERYTESFSESVFQSEESLRHAVFGHNETISTVRVLLVGPGGAGKTTLSERLQNIPSINTECKTATIGINYLDHQSLQLRGEDSAFDGLDVPTDLKLYLWDFGGQTLFHGMHKSFLHENCVYVLVVDSRHEQAPDEWLQQIYYQAGLKRKDRSKAFTVLLISNEYDNCRNQQNEQRLKRQFPEIDLQFFYFPCNDPTHEQLKTFKQALLKTAEASRHSVSKQVMDVGDSLKEQFKTKTFLGYGQLRDLLQASLGKVELSDRIKQLETLGWIINTADLKQEESYCLNPAWVVDHAYHLLYWLSVRPLDTEKETGQQRSVVSKNQLVEEAETYFDQLQANLIEEEQAKLKDKPLLNNANLEKLVKFLKSSRVCKALDDGRLFFPDLARANEPEILQTLLQQTSVVIEFHLPYIPIGLAAHLVCHWLEKETVEKARIDVIDDVWREGFPLCQNSCLNHSQGF